MKQREDTKTGNLLASANARRQAAFKARWTDAGWRRLSLWVNEKDFAAGKKAARDGRSAYPGSPIFDGVDLRSWMLGFAEGLASNPSVAGRALRSRGEVASAPAPTREPLVGRKASRARSVGAA